MYANQSRLPRLPLPSLEDTLERYLRASRSLVDASQHEATERTVKEALQPGSGLRLLHQELTQADESRAEASYIASAWDAMYLEGRWPLPLNSNPAFVVEESMFDPSVTTQVQRAARIIAATAHFATRVEARTLTPDAFKGVPTDMMQYERMFASTRRPLRGRDVLEKAAPPFVGHIVVLRGSTFWRVPVLVAADDGTGLPPTTGSASVVSLPQLERMLGSICDAVPNATSAAGVAEPEPSLAALTTLDRDSWADARATLEASPTNARSLRAIDEALFHVCLDVDHAIGASTEAAVRASLCGHAASAPRWFDQSITLMISSDGVPMGSFEHAWGDGIAMCGAESLEPTAEGHLHAPCMHPACR